jgi:hypothetical protein
MSRLLSRRTLLRGAATAMVGLPLLEAMLTPKAFAAGGGIPKRFGLFYWGNGMLPDRWTPTGIGQGYTMSEQLAPLESLRDKVTIVTGTSVKLPNTVPHGSGAAGILTGAPLLNPIDGESFSAATIDQVIANAIGGTTFFRSLQTAGTNCSGLSFSGPNARNPAETDPFAVYQRLFGDTFVEPGGTGQVDPTLGLRRSVLDAVMGDIESLQGKVGATDRTRLDQHLTGVRELEGRLARLEEDPPNLEACHRADAPEISYPDIDGRPQVQARNQAMADLMALAMACDQTRVAAHYLSHPVNDVLFADAPAGHHDLTHNEPGDQPEVHKITVQCIEAYAGFLAALDAIPEAEGTLLDHMVVLGTSEISLGRTHSLDEMPILLGGSCCGALKMGHHVRSVSQENSSKVLLSLIRALDIVQGSFGSDAGLASDGFSGIEA